MTEVTFYHLTETTLDEALPTLVQKAFARRWRTVVQVRDAEACERVDALLWSHEPVSFLPHGRDGDTSAEDHPVYVTATQDNPNAASMRFVVDGAWPPSDLSAHDRVAVMFDGRDDQLVAMARDQWRALKDAGHALSYYRQTPDGRWQKAS